MGQAFSITQTTEHDRTTGNLYNRRWKFAEKLALAAKLGGAVERCTGNIRFVGLMGKPEYVFFHKGLLMTLSVDGQHYVGEQAWEEIRRRVQFFRTHPTRVSGASHEDAVISSVDADRRRKGVN